MPKYRLCSSPFYSVTSGSSGQPPKKKEEARMRFVKLNYSLETGDSERIGLDHVAREGRKTADKGGHFL